LDQKVCFSARNASLFSPMLSKLIVGANKRFILVVVVIEKCNVLFGVLRLKNVMFCICFYFSNRKRIQCSSTPLFPFLTGQAMLIEMLDTSSDPKKRCIGFFLHSENSNSGKRNCSLNGNREK
jgi:hypothetical protein